MSIATLILGESGTGKTASLRNLDPGKCLLIQPTRKPLPFRAKKWSEKLQDGMTRANVKVTEDPKEICFLMEKTKAEIIIVDDFQYMLANLFMKMRDVKGYDKFNMIGGAGFDVVKKATELEGDKRVYILCHTTTDEYGMTRVKTIGKMLDDKIVVEGMVTTVLRTKVENGKYVFLTHNNGSDTVKSPMGMFEADEIDNDLNLVDQTICGFYDIPQQVQTAAKQEGAK